MKKLTGVIYVMLIASTLLHSCEFKKTHSSDQEQINSNNNRISIILDTDANNELDDQHAIAYAVLNDKFDIKGITVNATTNGGNIEKHYAEALRVLRLCNATHIPLINGANANFSEIVDSIEQMHFDGKDAVDFIIDKAMSEPDTMVLIAVGKLTNVALAVRKNPEIITKIRLVWLGSNYPSPGEYNLENDIDALNFLLKTNIHFEMPVCRYGLPDGTDAVKVSRKDIEINMKGKGPKATQLVEGRHGGLFSSFGDYSYSLFENAEYYGEPPSRSLFDMAAVAIVKNPEWATKTKVSTSEYADGQWQVDSLSMKKIFIWEEFNKNEILKDFYATFN